MDVLDEFDTKTAEVDHFAATETKKKKVRFLQPNFCESTEILHKDILSDHSFITCGYVCPKIYRNDSSIEQKICVTSKHLAWCLSSKYIFGILTHKSNCSGLSGSYSSTDGMIFTIVGDLAVVNCAVEMIRQLIFLGVDHLVSMPDVQFKRKK
jgi:hypothetical protein